MFDGFPLIDLRTDTITMPSDEMRKAIAAAAVGDDVYEEDPTVSALESYAAELLGKESSLFVSSGTMGNLISSMIHGRDLRSEIIVGSDSHVARDEAGGISAIAKVHTFQVPTDRQTGMLNLDVLREAVLAEPDVHYSIPRAVFLENTHGNFGGKVLSLAYIEEVRKICRARTENYVALHCDGARLWNASVALGVAPMELAAPFDTVTCCLSKGLGAPMGSVLAGTKDFIREARWARKLLGGGMRQVGFMAAAGLFALRHNIPKLQTDHDNAAHIVRSVTLAAQPVIGAGHLLLEPPQSNIVLFQLKNGAKRDEVVAYCKERGVVVGAWPGNAIRLVTQCNVREPALIDRAAQIISAALLTAFKL